MADTAPPPMQAGAAVAPIQVGEHFGRRLRYAEEQIVEFARLCLDTNPRHRPDAPDLIASGQQTAALMMGLLASHFTRDDDGLRREMLCLNVNFAYKAPIRAQTEIDMRWFVAAVDYNSRLAGWVGQLNGSAYSHGTDCVIARATVLVKPG